MSLIPVKVIKNKISPKQQGEEEMFKEKKKYTFPVFSWDKVAKIILYLLVFLLPLFFLPGLFNVTELPKQLLLITFISVALFCWFLHGLIRGEAKFKWNPFLYGPILILVLVWIISTIFSYSRYGSFWGWPLVPAESLLSLILFSLFFFLVVHIFQKREEFIFLLKLIVLSGFFAALFGILQLFQKFLLPFDFTKAASFTTVGLPSALAVFSASLIPLAVGLSFAHRSWRKVILLFISITMLFLLLLVNVWTAWAVLLLGSAALLGFILIWPRVPRAEIVVPMLLLVFSVLFILYRGPIQVLPAVPVEVFPTHRGTFNITIQALKERPILGTGPGTFIFNYSKFKNPDVNQTIFWNTRFAVGASKLTDAFATSGILGGISFILLIGSVCYLFWRKIRAAPKEEDKAEDFLSVALGAGFAGAAAALIFSFSTLYLNLNFWLMVSGLAFLSGIGTREYVKYFTSESRSSVIFSFALVAVIIFGLGLLYLSSQRVLAEMNYFKSLQVFSNGDLEGSASLISIAISHNPNQDIYFRDLAQVYFAILRRELARADLSQEQLGQIINSFVPRIINLSQQATNLEPKNVANWSVRGFLYQNLSGIVSGAEDAALSYGYERARELEPSNPYFVSEIGRIYIQKATLAQQAQDANQTSDNLIKAEEQLKNAISLKSDYAPAHFLLAVVAQMRGNISEAISKLETAKTFDPLDVGLAFRLGVLYYQTNQFDKAKQELERAVLLNENYSNARYFLGLIYDQEGARQKAIEQFERIQELNPNNMEVKNILENLRAGKQALEGILQVQPPSLPVEEEKPEEIKE